MEIEHSGIFRVELVTKNVVLGSSGNHFVHMRVKEVEQLKHSSSSKSAAACK